MIRDRDSLKSGNLLRSGDLLLSPSLDVSLKILVGSKDFQSVYLFMNEI